MKFATLEDKRLFLLEVERPQLIGEVSEEWKPSQELVELFFKRRRELVGKIKNFRKSQNTKQQWRKDRYKMMTGIKRFHRSTAGKQFHRSIGRFIATRESLSTENMLESVSVLKALSSLKTHSFIEVDYYMSLSEYVDYLIFLEELIPTVDRVEKAILNFSFDIEPDDEEFLIRTTEAASIWRQLADQAGKTVEEVEQAWEQVKQELITQDITEDEDTFYTRLLTDLKAKLGLR